MLNINKKMLLLLCCISFAFSAEVYDISPEEYTKYKSNPNEMLKSFVSKFVLKTKVEPEIKKVKVSPVEVLEENTLYSKNYLLDKLTLIGLQNEKNIDKFVSSIDEIITKNGFGYDIKDISLVLQQIKSKEISPFESKIYLDQIAKIIKG